MASIVVVGISEGVSCTDYISRKLNTLLKDVGQFEIHAVNDKHRTLSSYAESLDIKISHVSCDARISAKQIISRATHFVIFWTGYDLHELVFFAAIKKIPSRIVPIPLTTVANKDKNQPFDIYIGRGSPGVIHFQLTTLLMWIERKLSSATVRTSTMKL